MPESSMAEVCCYQRQQEQCENISIKTKLKKNLSAIKELKKSRKIGKHLQATSIKPLEEVDQNNNNNNNNSDNHNGLESAFPHAKSTPIYSGLLFKYQANSSSRDIENLRELLRAERRLQLRGFAQMGSQEVDFYASDYERMMIDDWLVTRFLLRGTKAFEREAPDEERKMIEAEREGSFNSKDDSESLRDSKRTPARRAILGHTLELIKVCAKFRFEYSINGQTKLSEFPLEWTKVEGLIHHKPDLVGNPTAYLRVALHKPKLIETPEARKQFKRYMLYLLECCDRELFNAPGKAICCIFDMTNAGLENIDLELTSWMIKSFKSCSPKLLCYVVVYNPPWFFTATFKVMCNTLLSTSKRQSVKFAYGNEILNYVCYANLPSYLKSSIH